MTGGPAAVQHPAAGGDAAARGDAAASGISALQRLASFRFPYLAIFAFLVAYVFTVQGLEHVLRRHFQAVVVEAASVDPADGPVAEQIRDRLTATLQASPWIRWGDVRVRPLVLSTDGRTLLYAGGGVVPAPPDATGGADLLPALVDVDVSVPHNGLLANAVLVGYASLLVTALVLYTRRLAAREEREIQELSQERDRIATRARGIESELRSVRERLDQVEPERELYAEEVEALGAERSRLLARLAELETRKEELRSRSTEARELDDERRALEELLEEATRELQSRDEEITDLRSQVRRSSRGGRAPRELELLSRRFAALYKELEMDEHALRNLVDLRDEGLKLRAEEALKRLADESESAAVRRKVGGLPPHLNVFELGYAGKGRIYYTRGRSRRYRVLAIGAKNSQKTDLEYLSRLPKEA